MIAPLTTKTLPQHSSPSLVATIFTWKTVGSWITLPFMLICAFRFQDASGQNFSLPSEPLLGYALPGNLELIFPDYPDPTSSKARLCHPQEARNWAGVTFEERRVGRKGSQQKLLVGLGIGLYSLAFGCGKRGTPVQPPWKWEKWTKKTHWWRHAQRPWTSRPSTWTKKGTLRPSIPRPIHVWSIVIQLYSYAVVPE